MTDYEIQQQKFRTRAEWSSVGTFALIFWLLARQLASMFGWIVETLLAWSGGWREVLLIEAAWLGDPGVEFYRSPPLRSLYEHAPLIVPLAGILGALLLSYLWPLRSALAPRLAAAIVGLELIRSTTLTPAIDSILVATESALRSPLVTEPWSFGLLVAGLVTAMLLSRSIVSFFGSSRPIDRLPERTAIVFVTILLPLVILTLMEWIGGYQKGALGSAALLVCTLPAIRRRRRANWPNVSPLILRREIVMASIVALLLISSSLYVFRGPLTGFEERVVLVSGTNVEVIGRHEMLRRQLRDPDSLERRGEMKIEWSNPSPDDDPNDRDSAGERSQ